MMMSSPAPALTERCMDLTVTITSASALPSPSMWTTFPVVIASIILYSASVIGPVTVTVASVTSTLLSAVIKAAMISVILPVTSTALVTLTVPVVLPPIAASSVAVISVASASLIVTVASETITLVQVFTNPDMTST